MSESPHTGRKKSTWGTHDASPHPRAHTDAPELDNEPAVAAVVDPEDLIGMPYSAHHEGVSTDAGHRSENAVDGTGGQPDAGTGGSDVVPRAPSGLDSVFDERSQGSSTTSTPGDLRADTDVNVHMDATANPFAVDLIEPPEAHDLGSLFDDDATDMVESVNDSAADSQPDHAPVPALGPYTDTADSFRELNVGVTLTPEQLTAVGDLIALTVTGDPELQNAISHFEISQDPAVDLQQFQAYKTAVENLMPKKGVRISNPTDYPIVLAAAYDQLLGLGPLGPLWRDADITDIMVTGPNKVIVDKNGFLYRTNVHFTSAAALLETGRRLSTRVDDRAVSRSNPLVTVQLDKARVQLAWPPIARSGGNITIRKHRRRLSLPELLDRQALSPAMAALISDAVISQAALLVSGGTGTGKTTYLNIASGFIPDTERVIVIEDAAELDLTNSFVEYYLTKQRASADDQVTIEFKQILQSVLRMRPDRIIVGEILTAEGAEAMLTASYTGHDGTMSTIHANNPHEALARLADLAREATGAPDELTRKKVAGTFDLLIHVDKNKQTGVRFVSEIATVNDDGTTETIFSGAVSVTVDPDTGTATGTPVFTKVGALRADTSIAIRMRESGIDTGPWERTS